MSYVSFKKIAEAKKLIDTVYILLQILGEGADGGSVWRLPVREATNMIDFHPSSYLLCLPTIKTDQNNKLPWQVSHGIKNIS